MECLVCGHAGAEQIPPGVGRIGIACRVCGEYDVETAVIAAGQWQSFEPDRRRDILDKAKRWAQQGTRPLIRSYLLD
jgi:hypothetical protein